MNDRSQAGTFFSLHGKSLLAYHSKILSKQEQMPKETFLQIAGVLEKKNDVALIQKASKGKDIDEI